MRIHDQTAVSWARLLLIALMTFVFGALLQTLNARAQSPRLSASPNKVKSQLDACLVKVPTPEVKPSLHRVIQLVNCSNQNLLAAANAAQQKGGQPVPVLPESGSWVIKKAGSSNNQNVLTIDIPLTWVDTQCPPNAHGQCQGIIGPRFWARTGCRYDLGFDKAQCETGGCAGRYDCSAARLSGVGGTTVSEWTFAQPAAPFYRARICLALKVYMASSKPR
jgi:Thaumatin family